MGRACRGEERRKQATRWNEGQGFSVEDVGLQAPDRTWSLEASLLTAKPSSPKQLSGRGEYGQYDAHAGAFSGSASEYRLTT